MKFGKHLPLALLIAIVPGMIVFFAVRTKMDPEEALIRANSAHNGLDPDVMGNLYQAEMIIRKGGDYERAWRTLEAQTHSNDTTQRLNAYGIVVVVKDGPLRAKALKAIEGMKRDPDPEVRAKYPWNLMLLNAPHWRETCQRLTTSADTATRQYALRSLDVGKGKQDRTD